MKHTRVVCFGEILWDNLKEGRRLGGAPLNVCYHLTKSGIESSIISQVGNDQNGEAIFTELKKLGVDTRFCAISMEKPTSTVEVHMNGQELRYEIVEDVAWDYIETTPEMIELVKAADALVFGSLVTRSEISRKTLFRLMEESRFLVFDMNLRAPFYDRDGIFRLMNKTDLLKLNEDELGIVSGWLGENSTEKQQQLQTIRKQFPNIAEIILTLGAEGSVYFSTNEFVEKKANKVRVKDTVGSGDSFLAAFLANKLKGSSIADSLDRASLLSGFIATQAGACPVYDENDLLRFKQSIDLIQYQ
ncbi:carbohydrate kinase family protein [Pseudobacter ginsenosidimutans]|uniref:Fructokinase n=1 Tax=Pseudobacter ginsenosidimutans TaxID=661488 RepID=A0A4Q7MB46_9BACT|nr:carbohydrate kinase [Pseudobacter ginsenosidimutans]QEC42569.1 carbohydrate kinase [Pseudobacter ginsenosidimutans]RZS63942.1 fructokinase [Pseudobacter ginsenosidimutans]